MNNRLVGNGWVDAKDTAPRVGHSVIYQTPTHHALGFLDSTGRWLSFEGRVEPEPVLAWLEPRKPAKIYHRPRAAFATPGIV